MDVGLGTEVRFPVLARKGQVSNPPTLTLGISTNGTEESLSLTSSKDKS